ncbi:MAG: hypothetical protein RNU03_17845 [Candidatus Sedimenticola sp. (ex Thyasira tokunagai)]
MKSYIPTFIVCFFLTSSVIAENDYKFEYPDFFELSPSQQYPFEISNELKNHFLPYAYIKAKLPTDSVISFAHEYRINVNKKTNVIGHVSINKKVANMAECEDFKKIALLALRKNGYTDANPSKMFFSRVAIKGGLVAQLHCSSRIINYGTPSEKTLPPELSFTITDEEQHLLFEKTMRELEH